MTTINQKFLKRLRIVSIVEGISTLILFGIAMPLKYMAGMPMAVSVAGTIHGALFVLLAIMLMLAVNKVPIPTGTAMGGLLAAIVPFGPFVFDTYLKKAAGDSAEPAATSAETEQND